METYNLPSSHQFIYNQVFKHQSLTEVTTRLLLSNDLIGPTVKIICLERFIVHKGLWISNHCLFSRYKLIVDIFEKPQSCYKNKISYLSSFTQQIIFKHLLQSSTILGSGNTSVSKRHPSLRDPTYKWKKTDNSNKKISLNTICKLTGGEKSTLYQVFT